MDNELTYVLKVLTLIPKDTWKSNGDNTIVSNYNGTDYSIREIWDLSECFAFAYSIGNVKGQVGNTLFRSTESEIFKLCKRLFKYVGRKENSEQESQNISFLKQLLSNFNIKV